MKFFVLLLLAGVSFSSLRAQEMTLGEEGDNTRGVGGLAGAQWGNHRGIEQGAYSPREAIVAVGKHGTYGVHTNFGYEISGEGLGLDARFQVTKNLVEPNLQRDDRGKALPQAAKPMAVIGVEPANFETATSIAYEEKNGNVQTMPGHDAYFAWRPALSAGAYLPIGTCDAMLIARPLSMNVQSSTRSPGDGVQPSFGASAILACKRALFAADFNRTAATKDGVNVDSVMMSTGVKLVKLGNEWLAVGASVSARGAGPQGAKAYDLPVLPEATSEVRLQGGVHAAF